MLHGNNVLWRFLAECMRVTTHVINRHPKQRLGFKSPYEKFLTIKSTVKHFRVFGCVCYVFVPDHPRSKFDKKAIKCIFVGYDNQRKGWRCIIDPVTGRCYTSRNVIFDEASSWWAPKSEKAPTDERSFKEGLKEEMSQVQQAPIEEEEDLPEENSGEEEQSRT